MTERCLPVLMYHGLHTTDAQTDAHFDPVYSVRPRDFERQLDWLCAQGYRSLRLDQIADANDGEKRLIISFDDGDASNRCVALPLLTKRGMVAEFFITSDFIGLPGMLSENDVRALSEAGMGVQSHGCSHLFLEDLDDAQLESELVMSKRRLDALCTRPVSALALPGGRGGKRERMAALQAGYRHVLTSVPGVNRGKLAGDCRERLAITRDMRLADFAASLEWRGWQPHMMRLRYNALALPKRLLGNARYQRLRARLLGPVHQR